MQFAKLGDSPMFRKQHTFLLLIMGVYGSVSSLGCWADSRPLLRLRKVNSIGKVSISFPIMPRLVHSPVDCDDKDFQRQNLHEGDTNSNGSTLGKKT
ncbi:hypothetical protein K1719_014672 [Acacia pycnantha]|nr:hypothetical protein K1719_014672 [Acacia pycnantha]